MLSGIGDTSVLSSVGVETIVDLPDVGQNLQVSFCNRQPEYSDQYMTII